MLNTDGIPFLIERCYRVCYQFLWIRSVRLKYSLQKSLLVVVFEHVEDALYAIELWGVRHIEDWCDAKARVSTHRGLALVDGEVIEEDGHGSPLVDVREIVEELDKVILPHRPPVYSEQKYIAVGVGDRQKGQAWHREKLLVDLDGLML